MKQRTRTYAQPHVCGVSPFIGTCGGCQCLAQKRAKTNIEAAKQARIDWQAFCSSRSARAMRGLL